MTVRERTEEMEYKNLSPYAAKSRESTRERPLENVCPFRTDFQRDRDRILHSKSFRRLKRKTQVYITSGDHYRTRMTHSLEVSQISRTIARGLRLNEDLIEAIALGHDVGHTPFGHSGEAVMNELTGHFKHNEQSLRVVEYLERGGNGLNLTSEVRDGILKHSGKLRAKTLEGRVVHIADRIAYLCHDYDDSLRAGLLKEGDLPDAVYRALGRTTSEMITAMVSDIILSSDGKDDIYQSDHMRDVMDIYRKFMFENIYHSDKLKKEREQACYVLRELYMHYMNNPQDMPEDFRHREKRWGREQIVTDYVSGLTDSFAISLFKKIFLPPVDS